MGRIYYYSMIAVCAVFLTGCFSGFESSPPSELDGSSVFANDRYKISIDLPEGTLFRQGDRIILISTFSGPQDIVLRYDWQKQNADQSWRNLNLNSSTLMFLDLQSEDAGSYRVQVSFTLERYGEVTIYSNPVNIALDAQDPTPDPDAGYFQVIIAGGSQVFLDNVSDRASINISDLAAYNFEAVFPGLTFDAIRYSFSTGHSRTEQYSPYAACGDASGVFRDCVRDQGITGIYELTASAMLNGAVVSSIKVNVTHQPTTTPPPPSADCGNLANGSSESRTMYQTDVVQAPSICVSEVQTRTCGNGTLSAWSPNNYTFSSCSVRPSSGGGGGGGYDPTVGWTQIPTTSSTQLNYVSSRSGNDSNSGTMQSPLATFGAAFSRLSDGGTQGMVLLRNDEQFLNSDAFMKPDGTAAAPHVIAGYGSGTCPRMDDTFFRSHHGSGNSDGTLNLAIIGLCFHATQKDPSSSNFNVNTSESSGIGLIATLDNILIEGVNVRYGYINLQNNPNNVTVRRSVITDNYSTTGHSQGMYTNALNGFLLEESILDHNGWLIQQASRGANEKAGGQATMFNHNTYYTNARNVTMRNNVFMRPSSIQNKFTSNSNTGSDVINSENVTVEDNFYYDGEVMISAGGNTDHGTGPRFKNYRINNNVFTEAGTSRPTNRVLSWGIDVNDWDGGEVRNNILTNFVPGNSWYVNLKGHTSNVTVDGNILYNGNSRAFGSGGLLRITAQVRNLTVTNNHIQAPNSDEVLISLDPASVGQVRFSGNVYYSADPRPFRIGSTRLTFDEWRQRTGDTSEFRRISYPNPGRTFSGYASTQGMTLNQVYSHVRTLSKNNWETKISADAINKYFRAGFGR